MGIKLGQGLRTSGGGEGTVLPTMVDTYADALASAPKNGETFWIESQRLHLVWSSARGRFLTRSMFGATPTLTLRSLVVAREITGLSDGDSVSTEITSIPDLIGSSTWTPNDTGITWDSTDGPGGTPCLTFPSGDYLAGAGDALGIANAARNIYAHFVYYRNNISGLGTLLSLGDEFGTANVRAVWRTQADDWDVGARTADTDAGRAAILQGVVSATTWLSHGGLCRFTEGDVDALALPSSGTPLGLTTNLTSSSATGTEATDSGAVEVGQQINVNHLNGRLAGWVILTSDEVPSAAELTEAGLLLDLYTGLRS